jgi:hypothetical protein
MKKEVIPVLTVNPVVAVIFLSRGAQQASHEAVGAQQGSSSYSSDP